MGAINDYHILHSRFLNGPFVQYTLKIPLENIYESDEGMDSLQVPETSAIYITTNDQGISNRLSSDSHESDKSDQSSDSIVVIEVHNVVQRHQRTS